MRTLFPLGLDMYDAIKFVKANRHTINYPGCSTMLIDFCRTNPSFAPGKVLETFLDVGADVDMVDCNGENAMDAMLMSHTDIDQSFYKLIEASKYGINRQCHRGGSYLFRANNSRKITNLVDNGIDVNLQTKNGFTALDHINGQLKWAMYSNDEDKIAVYNSCATQIRKHGGKPGTSKDPRLQYFFF